MASITQPTSAPDIDSAHGTVESTSRKGRMEPLINIVAFAIFALLWAGFAVALVWSQGSLDAAWTWIQSLALPLQIVVWLLFLPVVAGLWVWEASWPVLVRLPIVIVLAAVTLYVFFPKDVLAAR